MVYPTALLLLKLTLDSEPGVAGDVAGRAGGGALEHAGVLSPHVVDVEAVVGQDGVANSRDVGERLGVTVPGHVRPRFTTNVARDLQFRPELSQRFERHLRLEMRLLCNVIQLILSLT